MPPVCQDHSEHSFRLKNLEDSYEKLANAVSEVKETLVRAATIGGLIVAGIPTLVQIAFHRGWL